MIKPRGSAPLLVLPICCFPTPPHVQATAEWPAWASHGLGLLRSCYPMHTGRQQQLSPCRRETWLEIGGKRCQESGVIGFAGAGFDSVKIASQICVCWWKWWVFGVNNLFPPQKKRLQTKRSRAFDQSTMDYTFQVVGRKKKNFQKENLCWNYPSKEGPQETNMEPKNWWFWVDVSGHFQVNHPLVLLDVLILEGEAQKERFANHL